MVFSWNISIILGCLMSILYIFWKRKKYTRTSGHIMKLFSIDMASRKEELQMRKRQGKQLGKRQNKKKIGTSPLFRSHHTWDLQRRRIITNREKEEG
jgi:hypothetical protein